MAITVPRIGGGFIASGPVGGDGAVGPIGHDGQPGRDGAVGPVGPIGPAGAGAIRSYTARGVVLPCSAVIVLSDGRCAQADQGDPSHRGKVVGITAAGAADGGTVTVQTSGDLDGVSGDFTGGEPLYVSRAGTLTAAAPTSGWIQLVATAAALNRIVVNLGTASLISTAQTGLVLGGGGFATKAPDDAAAAADLADAWVSGAGLNNALLKILDTALFAAAARRPFLPDDGTVPRAGGWFRRGTPEIFDLVYIAPRT